MAYLYSYFEEKLCSKKYNGEETYILETINISLYEAKTEWC